MFSRKRSGTNLQGATAAILAAMLSACGATTPAPTVGGSSSDGTVSPTTGRTGAPSGTQGAAESARSTDPFALTGSVREDTIPTEINTVPASLKLPVAAKGLRPEPAECAAMLKRTPAPAPACADKAAALAALDAALLEPDSQKSDAKLAGLEACAGLPVGVARALRMELNHFTPPNTLLVCGETLATPLLSSTPRGLSAPVHLTLLGHALASRARRQDSKMPEFKGGPTSTREDLLTFINTKVADWLKTQHENLDEVEKVTLAMPPSYGRAIAAGAVGRAWMKTAASMRATPIPEWLKGKNQAELRSAYYAGLDAAAEPRVERGRRAFVQSFRDFSAVGALREERAMPNTLVRPFERPNRALGVFNDAHNVAFLSTLVSPLSPPSMKPAPPGPPPAGLQPSPPRAHMLQVPRLADAAPKSVEERLALSLPTFYSGLLLDPALVKQPSFLRFLMVQGISAPHRAALKGLKGADLSPEMARLYAHGRLLLGIRWMQAMQFDQAASLAATAASNEGREGEAGILLATALALRNGPTDVSDWMALAPEPAPAGFGDVSALDAFAKANPKGPFAWHALYNAALIREYTAVPKDKGARVAFYREQARRYREAAALLPKDVQAGVLLEADGAEATAKFLEEPSQVPPGPDVGIPPVQVNGALPREFIQDVVRAESDRIQICFADARKKNASLKWRIWVRFLIDLDGYVQYAEAPVDTLGIPAAQECVLRAFSKLRFQWHNQGVTSVIYPIEASTPL